ncbi:MAG: hypothetical protein D6692_05415 [Planctomycetota bacterium]|nr:MAG: hypothetical protein D6692_05415 [Planctomycetota bacterium]
MPGELEPTVVAPPGADAAPEATPDAGPDNAPAQPNERLFAGTFKNEEALLKGIREIRKKAGLDTADDEVIVGENGLFPTVESAERHYTEMRSLVTRMAQSKSRDDSPTIDAPEPKIRAGERTNPESIEDVVSMAGFDLKSLGDHWSEHGSLPDDFVQSLKKNDVQITLTPRMVEQYMASAHQAHRARESALKAALITESGGEENYLNIISWAREHASEPVKRLFRIAANDDDDPISATRPVFAIIKQEYEAFNATRPDDQKPAGGVITGSGTRTVQAAEPFESHHQMVTAMNESVKAHGSVANDPEFARRFAATPAHIRNGMSA